MPKFPRSRIDLLDRMYASGSCPQGSHYRIAVVDCDEINRGELRLELISRSAGLKPGETARFNFLEESSGQICPIIRYDFPGMEVFWDFPQPGIVHLGGIEELA